MHARQSLNLLLVGAGALVLANLVMLAVLADSDAVSWGAPGHALWAAPLAVAVSGLAFALVWTLVQRVRAAQQRGDVAASQHAEVLDALNASVVLFDAQNRLLVTNRGFRELYGDIPGGLLPGTSFETLLRNAVQAGQVPQAADNPEAFIAERLAAHRDRAGPVLRRLDGGRWRQIVDTQLPSGHRLSYSFDVTVLVNQELALATARRETELAHRRLEDAVRALPCGFELYDAQDRLVLSNQVMGDFYPQLADMLDKQPSFELLMRTYHARGWLPQLQDASALDAWLAQRQEQRRKPGGSQRHERTPAGRWLRVDERPMRDGGVVAVRADITELVQREEELSRLNAQLDTLNVELGLLSDTDPLTGLANRRLFDRRVAEEWARARRHGVPLALLLFDIDHFKRYNDRNGHLAGDTCLCRVAELLRDAARRPTDVVARLGGEEFAMLLPHLDGPAAQAQAERCLAALQAAAIPHGDSPVDACVTFSVGGVSMQPGEDGERVQLMAAADVALYRAKQEGRRRVVMAG